MGLLGFIRSYMNKNAISLNRYGEIASFLGGISQYTYNQFLNLLLYLYFTLTGVCLNLEEAFGFSDTEYQTLVGQQHSSNLYQSREEGILHGTYFLSKECLN